MCRTYFMYIFVYLVRHICLGVAVSIKKGLPLRRNQFRSSSLRCLPDNKLHLKTILSNWYIAVGRAECVNGNVLRPNGRACCCFDSVYHPYWSIILHLWIYFLVMVGHGRCFHVWMPLWILLQCFFRSRKLRICNLACILSLINGLCVRMHAHSSYSMLLN